ncbi:hypothetical protein LINPERPRIM_LOCUS20258 [Linum perenne]
MLCTLQVGVNWDTVLTDHDNTNSNQKDLNSGYDAV